MNSVKTLWTIAIGLANLAMLGAPSSLYAASKATELKTEIQGDLLMEDGTVSFLHAGSKEKCAEQTVRDMKKFKVGDGNEDSRQNILCDQRLNSRWNLKGEMFVSGGNTFTRFRQIEKAMPALGLPGVFEAKPPRRRLPTRAARLA